MIMFLYIVFMVGSLVLFAAGLFEQLRHYRNLHSIPTRVMVNGIRGKSDITRLCAGALRSAALCSEGLHTVAKTTGSSARFIFPDGSEKDIDRTFDFANVAEQFKVVRRAVAEDSDVLVIECMAVLPELQEVTQEKFVQSNIGIISNVREDHLEEMGPTLDDVARSLSKGMPKKGVCFTAEQERFGILQEEAEKRNCRLVHVDPESVSDEEMEGFRYLTFKENVALALAVAEELGVDREEALEGMQEANPDPGALTVEEYCVGDKLLRVANLFAANDPDSTLTSLQRLREAETVRSPIFALINCRPDRVERNRQMGRIVPELAVDKLFVVGEPTEPAREQVPEAWEGEVVDLGGDREAQEILERIMDEVDNEASLVGIGNIHGQAERLLEHLEHLEQQETRQR